MKGADRSGSPVERSPSGRGPKYKGLLPLETVVEYRIQLHKNLLAADFSPTQITQISGWSVRTVRRDLNETPKVSGIRPFVVPENQSSELSAEDRQHLQKQYGDSDDPAVREFLQKVLDPETTNE